MLADPQTVVQPRSYASGNQGVLSTKAHRLLCLFSPGALLIASVNRKGNAIGIQHYRHPDARAAWDADFFEEILLHDALLQSTHVPKLVFVAAEKQLVIPKKMYKADASASLLESIYYVGTDDLASTAECRTDKAILLYTCHQSVYNLAEKHFGSYEIYPVNHYQFQKNLRYSGPAVDCLFGEQVAYLTLRQKGKLIWHQPFAYAGPMDLVYQLALLCREKSIDVEELQIRCTASHPSAGECILALDQYFPDLGFQYYEDEQEEWMPLLYLLQQLSQCVS